MNKKPNKIKNRNTKSRKKMKEKKTFIGLTLTEWSAVVSIAVGILECINLFLTITM